jgi:hypothetical protein
MFWMHVSTDKAFSLFRTFTGRSVQHFQKSCILFWTSNGQSVKCLLNAHISKRVLSMFWRQMPKRRCVNVSTYEETSVNRSQIDIKRKTFDIRTWKEKHLFLDTSSTNIDTLAPSLYQCVETRSIDIFWMLSPPFPRLRFNVFVIRETSATQLWTALRDKYFPPLRANISLWISFASSHFAHKKTAQQNASLRQYTPQARSPFWLLKSASEHAHAHFLPRLSWSWTVLLPSDTHIKPTASITGVLLPFVTYLLTHRIKVFSMFWTHAFTERMVQYETCIHRALSTIHALVYVISFMTTHFNLGVSASMLHHDLNLYKTSTWLGKEGRKIIYPFIPLIPFLSLYSSKIFPSCFPILYLAFLLPFLFPLLSPSSSR